MASVSPSYQHLSKLHLQVDLTCSHSERLLSYQTSLSTCSGCIDGGGHGLGRSYLQIFPLCFSLSFLFERESEWCYLQPCWGRLADLRDNDADINSVMLLLQAHRDESTALTAQHSMLESACKEHEGNKNIFTKVLSVMIQIGAFGHPVILLFLCPSLLLPSHSLFFLLFQSTRMRFIYNLLKFSLFPELIWKTLGVFCFVI